jgi:drug/metabolite transporter (DMT)-like permease
VNTRSIPYILLLGAFFGSTLVVSRFSVEQFSPTTYIGLRFLIACFAFAIIYTLRIGNRRWPIGADLWGKSAIMGVFGTAFPMTGIVSSLEYLSSGLVSILITVGPAFTVLIAHFFLDDEPLTRRKVIGILLSLSGAILLIFLGESGLPDVSQAEPIGYFLVLGGMLAGSIMTVYARKSMRDCDTFDVTGIRMFVGAMFVIPLSLILEGFDLSMVDINGWLGLIYAAAIGSCLGMMLSLYNIQRFGPTAAVMTTYVVPIMAGVIGVLFLGEKITWGMAASIVLIALGVWIINSDSRQRITETYT